MKVAEIIKLIIQENLLSFVSVLISGVFWEEIFSPSSLGELTILILIPWENGL